MIPDVSTAFLDPFSASTTMVVASSIFDPVSKSYYDKDPRSIVQHITKYLNDTGIADTVCCGTEAEFFIFDNVRYSSGYNSGDYIVDSLELPSNSGKKYDYGNMGARPSIKGGYMPLPPVDSLSDIRSDILKSMQDAGLKPALHHHEVAPAQCEVGYEFDEICRAADKLQACKYIVKNTAASYGKTATFMPKPLAGDNGSGMHCHISLWKDGKNIFANDSGGLTDIAKNFIGGIFKHSKAICAFTNATTNSYKRLVPGFEAPVALAYAHMNRSAAVRIPYVVSPKACRIEARFPDASGNAYLCLGALVMAGLDGIINNADPGPEVECNLYDDANSSGIDRMPTSLQESLCGLKEDHAFLLNGNIFTKDMIDSYIALKNKEVNILNSTPAPCEFDMYYNS